MRKLNQRGSFIVWFTVAFALLGTFIGFALDFGRAYLEKARMARLIDSAAIAAAKVLKGQAGLENDATRAACDSMTMNGAPVVMNGNACTTTQGAPMSATVSFIDMVVPGGPPIRAVRVNATEPVPTTFLRFLGWMVPGDYSTINVNAVAEAGPERPVDLMLVLDRSGSMSAGTGVPGITKMEALKDAVSSFLNNTFSASDRIGMISFSTRGCGVNGSDTTAAVCTPDVPFDFVTSSFITSLQAKVNGLNAVGGTNTMEALRAARPPIANAFADSTRATARKAVLLVTDGQPTFMIRDNDSACKRNPYTNAVLPDPGDDNTGGGPFTNGCKHGVGSSQMFRQSLSNTGSSFTTIPTGGNQTEYLQTIRCTRSLINCQGTNGAMYEANQLRNCGYNNSACSAGGDHGTLVFVIAIGKKDLFAPQQSLDENAKCLLARIANATDIVHADTGVVETMTTNCNNKFTTGDGDTHADLVEGWPCASGPCIDTTQQKGKVFTINVAGDVNAQLQQAFAEIAAILKLRLVL
jgi:Flp pilus assembly protein TadG